MKRCGLYLLAASVAVQAQPFSGPVEGFAFDLQTSAVRVVLGRPGSAMLGRSTLPDVEFASVAPGRSYALAVREGRLILATNLDETEAHVADLGEARDSPDGVAWSGDGRIAVVFSRSNGWARLVRGMPDSPDAGEQIQLSSGSIVDVSADLHGENITVLRHDEHRSIVRFDRDLKPQPIPSLTDAVAITFCGLPGTLLVADASGSILAIDLATQSIDSRIAAGENILAMRCLGAQEGSPVLVTSTESRKARVYDTQRWEPIASIQLDFDADIPVHIGHSSLSLGGRGYAQEPLWVLSRRAGEWSVHFVPATPPREVEVSGP
jgi:hypothetical protein